MVPIILWIKAWMESFGTWSTDQLVRFAHVIFESLIQFAIFFVNIVGRRILGIGTWALAGLGSKIVTLCQNHKGAAVNLWAFASVVGDWVDFPSLWYCAELYFGGAIVILIFKRVWQLF